MKPAKRTPNPLAQALKRLVTRRGIDRIDLYAERDPRAPSYSDACLFTVRVTRQRGSAAPKTVETLEGIPGRIANGNTSDVEWHEYEGRKYPRYSEPYRPESGHWSFYGCGDVFLSAVRAFPLSFAPHFEIILDGGTTEGLTRASMHSDTIYLRGIGDDRIERPVRFLLDTACGAHNSARFGNPKHESDRGIFRAYSLEETA